MAGQGRGGERYTDNIGDAAATGEDAQLPGIGIIRLEQKESWYNPRGKPLPREPYFNKGFHLALKLATGVAVDLANTLIQSDQSKNLGSDLERHLKTARDLQNHNSDASRTVGIVGDSASGTLWTLLL